jgi:hypothetical protein
MITIDQEAKIGTKQPYEIDNMSPRYRTDNNIFTFSSPSMEVLNKYFYYLLRNSKIISFDNKYLYKPDYLSFDKYGSTNLEYLLMYINGVYTPEEFDLQTVIIPTLDAIIYICLDKYSTDKDIASYDAMNW